MHAVLSVNSCPLAISPVRQVVRFFRNEIGERVVGVSMVNPQSHRLALTWLKVNLLEVDKPLSRLPCLVRQCQVDLCRFFTGNVTGVRDCEGHVNTGQRAFVACEPSSP